MGNLYKVQFGLAALLVLVSNSGSVYAAIAGRVQYVHGRVLLTTAAGVTYPIKKGEAVNEGDTLISSPSASAQIRMEDGGMVAMRPDTKLKIDRFNFNGQEDGSERSFFSLIKGGFRAITGAIGQKNKVNYHITTPATIIGIRGTDHETFVVTQDSPLAASTPVGTYNKVNVGETSMTTEKGTLFVLPNQMGFAGSADQMPQLQPINLNIYTVTTPPAWQGSGDKHDSKLESRSEDGFREMRETATMDKDGMRDTAAINKIETHDAVTTENARMENAAARATPSTEEAIRNTTSNNPD